MRIIVNIDSTLLRKDPRAIAAVARGFLQGTIVYNQILLAWGLVPPLFDLHGQPAPVVFQREPWAGKWEEFADAYTCLQRGWGDCDDLAAWHCATLRNRGDRDANVKIYWRYNERGDVEVYHAEVRDGRGQVDDPSRLLGMASRRDG